MKSVRTILLALAGLLVVAGSASAAFNPNVAWTTPPTQNEMAISWVDMGSNVAGYHTWDMVVTVSATPNKAINDWSNAHFELTTSAGSILQVDNPWGLPHWSAQQMFWPMLAGLEWDTVAIGAPKNLSQQYIVPWPADKYGTPDVVTGAVCSTSAINMDWYDYAEEGPGTYHIFRLTVSDDWQGNYSGFLCDTANPGVGANFQMVPEPVTMGLLAIGGPRLRAVTHYGIERKDVEGAVGVVGETLA